MLKFRWKSWVHQMNTLKSKIHGVLEQDPSELRTFRSNRCRFCMKLPGCSLGVSWQQFAVMFKCRSDLIKLNRRSKRSSHWAAIISLCFNWQLTTTCWCLAALGSTAANSWKRGSVKKWTEWLPLCLVGQNSTLSVS